MNNLFISKKSIIFVLKKKQQDDNHYNHTHNHFLDCCNTNHLEDYFLYNQCDIYNYLFYN